MKRRTLAHSFTKENTYGNHLNKNVTNHGT